MQQHALFKMLDALDDAVIAVNESEEIRFCNRAGENLLRQPAEFLCGRLIWSLFPARTTEILRPFLSVVRGDSFDQEATRAFRVDLDEWGGNKRFVNIQIESLQCESELHYLFILKWPGNASGFIRQRRRDFYENPVVEELAAIEKGLKVLGDIMSGILPRAAPETGEIFFGLSEINRTLARVDLHLQPLLPRSKDRRFLAVKVMNLCVDYWIECTGASKFDLARDSKIWTVYTNPDGWERSQTLDKYLDVKTLPQRTNWRKILATADFVLASCFTPSVLRETLERTTQWLDFATNG